MIRFKDKIFEEYFIDPVTVVITDSNGVVQKTYLHQGRSTFKRMPVHCIMAHTFYGYKPDYVVHHLDENKLNNRLSNLVYLTKAEHSRLHSRGKAYMLGKNLSMETRAKISMSLTGREFSKEHREHISKSGKGRHYTLSDETKYNMSRAQSGQRLGWKFYHKEGEKDRFASKCPGPDWELGKTKKER